MPMLFDDEDEPATSAEAIADTFVKHFAKIEAATVSDHSTLVKAHNIASEQLFNGRDLIFNIDNVIQKKFLVRLRQSL